MNKKSNLCKFFQYFLCSTKTNVLKIAQSKKQKFDFPELCLILNDHAKYVENV